MGRSGADVVVVGCGPVGVMAALRLAQRGLDVLAIDKTPDIYPLPRAIGMDDEIQRLFQNAGLAAEVAAVSTPLAGADFVDVHGKRVVGFELPEGTIGACGHPPMAMFDQPRLEGHLRDAAVAAGVEFRFGVEAVAVDAEAGEVTVTDGSATSIVHGRWVIGADGASSTVRKLCGRSLQDQGFDQTWLVVDVTVLDETVELPNVARQFCDPARIATFVPGPERHRRWEFKLRDSETADEALAPAFLAERLQPWGTPDQLRVDRSAVYRFHATVVDEFRHHQVFLAGDAAHQMPPFNGQGMCTGMRDAENLAWKLAAVADGVAGEDLLDTYHQERQPHAAGQVQHSADAGRLIDAIAAGRDADTDAGYGGGRPFPHLEEGVLEAGHPAVGRQLPQPMLEGRLLDEHLGQGWALLTVDALPELPELWQALNASVVVVPDDLMPGVVDAGHTVMVRPDRYVAAVTADLGATTKHLAAWFVAFGDSPQRNT